MEDIYLEWFRVAIMQGGQYREDSMILGVDGMSAFDGPPPALPRLVQGVITGTAM
jgi:hypothetical protein